MKLYEVSNEIEKNTKKIYHPIYKVRRGNDRKNK